VFQTPAEAVNFIKNNKIEVVDLKLVALSGRWLHVSIPARIFDAAYFEEGVGYDGSSGSGFAKVESGDVSAIPDPTSAFLDPFTEHPTLSFVCDTVTADARAPFAADPRTIAKRAEAYLASTGIADAAVFAPEFEFHVLDYVRVSNQPFRAGVRIGCGESVGDGSRHPIAPQQGYMRVPPTDQIHDIRAEIVQELERIGIPIRYHHHEVGASGQCEIETRLMPLVRAADATQILKYVVKNVAASHNKIATFMPKPIYGESGNGMHVHQRLVKGGEPVFYDQSPTAYANLSDKALHYIAGLLLHGPALTGLTNPSTNSFKRLVEGFEAPVKLFFSLANRSAAIRVPRYATAPDQKRMEYRPPDFTSNVYLALSAMLMAGLDGIQRRIDPAAHNFGPFDVDIAAQDEEFKQSLASLPRSLADAMDALAADNDFLCKGEVFSKAFLDNWRRHKLIGEAREVAARPHPYEFHLYLDT
jgi:glutamine synthetase